MMICRYIAVVVLCAIGISAFAVTPPDTSVEDAVRHGKAAFLAYVVCPPVMIQP
jgi:hypothetical protein